MSFEERFQLLLESGQLTEPVLEVTQEIVYAIQNRYGITLTEENAGMFVTHIAMALQRIASGQPLETVSDEVWEETRQCQDEWSFARELAALARKRLEIQVPESELAYMVLHLRVLVGPVSMLGQ